MDFRTGATEMTERYREQGAHMAGQAYACLPPR
jgi:hypothetical protein